MTTDAQKQMATAWFASLQASICQAFEALELQLTPSQNGDQPPGEFVYEAWQHPQGGGGTMGLMQGRVFEKVGVNVSTVYGEFSDKFKAEIHGAADDPHFWAAGISVVAHMWNPHVPAIHMNTRHVVTSKSWFGGGTDLTPIVPCAEDTEFFHSHLKAVCDQHDPTYYDAYKKWCDEYFFLPHRNEPRGVGGIFFDYLASDKGWEGDFLFVQDVGRCFLDVYTKIVAKHSLTPWSEAERYHQLVRRGRYVEFNLLHDRGTRFGLQTGGKTEAILMSLPPQVIFPAEIRPT